MSDYDITTLILGEHEVFRREFARLEDLTDTAELAAAWTSLANQLEVHAAGEESMFYPHLVREAEAGAEETEHAIHDHNAIRDSVRAVAGQTPGSEAWWEAVRHARETNGDHMAEEERDILPDFRDNVDGERREALGMQWLEFHDDHEGAEGLSGEDKDPEAFVAEHS